MSFQVTLSLAGLAQQIAAALAVNPAIAAARVPFADLTAAAMSALTTTMPIAATPVVATSAAPVAAKTTRAASAKSPIPEVAAGTVRLVIADNRKTWNVCPSPELIAVVEALIKKFMAENHPAGAADAKLTKSTAAHGPGSLSLQKGAHNVNINGITELLSKAGYKVLVDSGSSKAASPVAAVAPAVKIAKEEAITYQKFQVYVGQNAHLFAGIANAANVNAAVTEAWATWEHNPARLPSEIAFNIENPDDGMETALTAKFNPAGFYVLTETCGLPDAADTVVYKHKGNGKVYFAGAFDASAAAGFIYDADYQEEMTAHGFMALTETVYLANTADFPAVLAEAFATKA